MMEIKNSIQKTLEKTEIHHNFLKNMEIRKNTEEWHVCYLPTEDIKPFGQNGLSVPRALTIWCI